MEEDAGQQRIRTNFFSLGRVEGIHCQCYEWKNRPISEVLDLFRVAEGLKIPFHFEVRSTSRMSSPHASGWSRWFKSKTERALRLFLFSLDEKRVQEKASIMKNEFPHLQEIEELRNSLSWNPSTRAAMAKAFEEFMRKITPCIGCRTLMFLSKSREHKKTGMDMRGDDDGDDVAKKFECMGGTVHIQLFLVDRGTLEASETQKPKFKSKSFETWRTNVLLQTDMEYVRNIEEDAFTGWREVSPFGVVSGDDPSPQSLYSDTPSFLHTKEASSKQTQTIHAPGAPHSSWSLLHLSRDEKTMLDLLFSFVPTEQLQSMWSHAMNPGAERVPESVVGGPMSCISARFGKPSKRRKMSTGSTGRSSQRHSSVSAPKRPMLKVDETGGAHASPISDGGIPHGSHSKSWSHTPHSLYRSSSCSPTPLLPPPPSADFSASPNLFGATSGPTPLQSDSGNRPILSIFHQSSDSPSSCVGISPEPGGPLPFISSLSEAPISSTAFTTGGTPSVTPTTATTRVGTHHEDIAKDKKQKPPQHDGKPGGGQLHRTSEGGMDGQMGDDDEVGDLMGLIDDFFEPSDQMEHNGGAIAGHDHFTDELRHDDMLTKEQEPSPHAGSDDSHGSGGAGMGMSAGVGGVSDGAVPRQEAGNSTGSPVGILNGVQIAKRRRTISALDSLDEDSWWSSIVQMSDDELTKRGLMQLERWKTRQGDKLRAYLDDLPFHRMSESDLSLVFMNRQHSMDVPSPRDKVILSPNLQNGLESLRMQSPATKIPGTLSQDDQRYDKKNARTLARRDAAGLRSESVRLRRDAVTDAYAKSLWTTFIVPSVRVRFQVSTLRDIVPHVEKLKACEELSSVAGPLEPKDLTKPISLPSEVIDAVQSIHSNPPHISVRFHANMVNISLNGIQKWDAMQLEPCHGEKSGCLRAIGINSEALGHQFVEFLRTMSSSYEDMNLGKIEFHNPDSDVKWMDHTLQPFPTSEDHLIQTITDFVQVSLNQWHQDALTPKESPIVLFCVFPWNMLSSCGISHRLHDAMQTVSDRIVIDFLDPRMLLTQSWDHDLIIRTCLNTFTRIRGLTDVASDRTSPFAMVNPLYTIDTTGRNHPEGQCLVISYSECDSGLYGYYAESTGTITGQCFVEFSEPNQSDLNGIFQRLWTCCSQGVVLNHIAHDSEHSEKEEKDMIGVDDDKGEVWGIYIWKFGGRMDQHEKDVWTSIDFGLKSGHIHLLDTYEAPFVSGMIHGDTEEEASGIGLHPLASPSRKFFCVPLDQQTWLWDSDHEDTEKQIDDARCRAWWILEDGDVADSEAQRGPLSSPNLKKKRRYRTSMMKKKSGDMGIAEEKIRRSEEDKLDEDSATNGSSFAQRCLEMRFLHVRDIGCDASTLDTCHIMEQCLQVVSDLCYIWDPFRPWAVSREKDRNANAVWGFDTVPIPFRRCAYARHLY